MAQDQRPDRRLLNDRERMILQSLAEGLTNREIGRRLALSENTVKWYLKEIYSKLGVHRRTQAVRTARTLQLLPHEKSLQPAPHRFTLPVTPLIGRDEEVSRIISLLSDPYTRLITILGMGGVGKTRIAQEVVMREYERGREAVCLVSLDSADTGLDIVTRIASALGIQFQGNSPPLEQLVLTLGNRDLLLILDTFEHLATESDVVGELISSTKAVKFIVTSRQRLHLKGETTLHIDGLDFPDDVEVITPDAYSSVALFISVARQFDPDFTPQGQDLQAIGRVCRMVEGLPLAIELAAEWVNVLAPDQVALEIQTNIDVLQTHANNVLDRHRSVSAVFEYSWQRLTAPDKAIMIRLSVFRDGFDRSAAQAVAGLNLFQLSELIDKSWLMRVGADRYKLHDLIRQFVFEKAEQEEQDYQQIREVHTAYYTSILFQFEKQCRIDYGRYDQLFQYIALNMGNISSAWRRAREQMNVRQVENCIFSLAWYYEMSGLLEKGKEELASVIAQFGAGSNTVPAPASLALRLETHYGWFCEALGDSERAERALLVARQIVEDSSNFAALDTCDICLLYSHLGFIRSMEGSLLECAHWLKRGLELSRKAGFQLVIWTSLTQLGYLECQLQQFDQAIPYFEEAVAFAETNQANIAAMYTLPLLSLAYAKNGEFVKSQGALKRTLAMHEIFPLVTPIFTGLVALAVLFWLVWSDFEQTVIITATLLAHPLCPRVARDSCLTLLKELEATMSHDRIENILRDVRHEHRSLPYLPIGFRADPALSRSLMPLVDAILNG